MRVLLTLLLAFGLAASAAADDRPAVAEIETAAALDAVEDAGHADGLHVGDDHGDGGHHETGMPSPRLDTAVASLIVFLIFLGLLTKFAWKPLMEGLSTREENIRGAMLEAQQAREEAQRARDEHARRMEGVDAEVKEIIAEARRDAEHTAAEIRGKAEAEAQASKNRALAEIERAKDAAIVELAARERDLIAEATETVLGRAITDDDRRRLIDEAVANFGQGA